MNDNSTKQQLIIRWMDGEVMTPEELEALEEIDKVSPEDVLDPTEFSLIRRQMKEAFALDADIPNGDLFATLLESRICREERESKEKEVLHGKVVHLTDENSHLSHSLNKIQWIPMIASAAACLVLGLIVGKSFLGESSEA